MKRIQNKTFHIYRKVLEKRIFSQRMLWRECNRTLSISLGHVNKIVRDLQDLGFIKRLSDMEMRYSTGLPDIKESNRRKSRYYLDDPVGLLKFISMFRSMKELIAFEMRVDVSKEVIHEELSSMDVILSLDSAMERYSTYYRSDRITFYSEKPEEVLEWIRSAPPGNQKLVCYLKDVDISALDLPDNDDSSINRSPFFFTDEVQTVIDMFCDGKSAYTKTLLEKHWGLSI